MQRRAEVAHAALAPDVHSRVPVVPSVVRVRDRESGGGRDVPRWYSVAQLTRVTRRSTMGVRLLVVCLLVRAMVCRPMRHGRPGGGQAHQEQH